MERHFLVITVSSIRFLFLKKKIIHANNRFGGLEMAILLKAIGIGVVGPRNCEDEARSVVVFGVLYSVA